jgi:hypothetical protein
MGHKAAFGLVGVGCGTMWKPGIASGVYMTQLLTYFKKWIGSKSC